MDEEGCREIIDSVWDPLSSDMGLTIMDKTKAILGSFAEMELESFWACE